MQLTLGACLALLAAPFALAAPVDSTNTVEPRLLGLGGGLRQIVSDHNRFVADPAAARVPIPEPQNNPAREGHRQAHVALGPANRLVPPVL